MSGLFDTGLSAIGGTTILGSIPNISGTVAETNIKAGAVQGYSNVGSKLPAMGSLIGAGMVLKQVKKLKKKTKSRR